MDTSLLNLKLIQARLSQIRASCSRLVILVSLTKDDFVRELDNFAIAEHHLRRALEAILDIGRHIIAKEGWGAPQDYRSILLTLGQRRVLPHEFVQKIQGIAGYRNRLVHGYVDVSAEEIYELLKHHLVDLAEFSQHIVFFLQRNERKG